MNEMEIKMRMTYLRLIRFILREIRVRERINIEKIMLISFFTSLLFVIQ